MAATVKDGPDYVYGNAAAISAAIGGTTGVVGDPNGDAGPNVVFQGIALLDPRYLFAKDQVTGNAGRVPAHILQPWMGSVNQIPAAVATNNIAAAQAVTNGTAMTLAADSLGITNNVPIIPYSVGGINELAIGASPVPVMAIDFGFAFATVVAGSTTVTISQSPIFSVGMPIVIGGAGAGGVPLLTRVVSFTSTTRMVIADSPSTSIDPAPIGTGNTWIGGEIIPGAPTAALPWVRGGPGLVLDTRQAVTRGVQIVGAGGSTGGNFLVSGYDIYNQPLNERVTVGAASTGWGVKAFKYIVSVTPQFSDTATYSVGTSDVFGFNYRMTLQEDTQLYWAVFQVVAAPLGLVFALSLIVASTAVTADVRGTFQASTNGGGTGQSASASNGTVSSLRMSGRRLTLRQILSPTVQISSFPVDSSQVFGVAQF